MFVALLLLVQQPRTVTFTHPCAHSSVVLEALGKQTGVKMAPGGSVLQDYFALKFTDRPVEDVKRVIAETLNAEWVQRGEYLVLDRGPSQLLKEDEEANEALRLGIKKFRDDNPVTEFSIDRAKAALVDVLASVGSPRFMEALTALQGTLPGSQVKGELARAFTDSFFCSMKEGEQKKFYIDASGRSNMTSPVQKVVRDYIDHTRQLMAVGEQIGAQDYLVAHGSLNSPEVLGHALTVTRDQFGVNIELRQDFVDTGSPIGSGGGFRFSIFDAQVTRGGIKPTLPTFTSKFELSPVQKSLVWVISSASPWQAMGNVPTEEDRAVALEMGKDLTKNELLTLYGSAPLLAVADETKRDFVALIPDFAALDSQWMAHAKDGDLKTVWNSWLGRMTLRLDEPTGILKLQPVSARIDRGRRFDRKIVTNYVAAYDRDNCVTLDAIADLAKTMPDMQAYFNHVYLANRFLNEKKNLFGEWFALKAFGELSANQRRQARNGGIVLPWQGLSEATRRVVEERIYSAGAFFMDEIPSPAVWDVGGMTIGRNPSRGSLAKSRAVPGGTTVSFIVYPNKLLVAGAKEGDARNNRLLDTDQFASMRKSDTGDTLADFTRAAVVNVERLHFAIHVPGIGNTYFAAQADDRSRKTTYVALDKLPEPFKTQLAEAIKKAGGGK